jgi:formylglycine-generating enzyme required for sulfatase activity
MCNMAEGVHRARRVVGSPISALLVVGACLVTAPAPASPAALRCEGIEADVAGSRRCLKPKDSFRDCPDCPEMIVIPAGSFLMGAGEDDPNRNLWWEQQVLITFAKPFAIGPFTVTRGEFAKFVAATGHKTANGCWGYTGQGPWAWASRDFKLWKDRSWRSPGFPQNDRHPVTCVNWDDAQAYVTWLSSTTGKIYRIQSEAEREYAARAGTTTPYWWGSTISTAQANYLDIDYTFPGRGKIRGEFRKRTVPVDSFAPNPWGLYNVHGNVREWTADCAHMSHAGNPGNGDARTDNCRPLIERIRRNDGWSSSAGPIRSAYRTGVFNNSGSDAGDNATGFRIARTLN